MTKLESNTRISRSPDAVSCEVAGETVALDLKSNRFFSLDPVGSRIWALIEEKGTFQAILEGILAEYEVEPARARDDLERLLEGLVSAGLVQLGDSRP